MTHTVVPLAPWPTPHFHNFGVALAGVPFLFDVLEEDGWSARDSFRLRYTVEALSPCCAERFVYDTQCGSIDCGRHYSTGPLTSFIGRFKDLDGLKKLESPGFMEWFEMWGVDALEGLLALTHLDEVFTGINEAIQTVWDSGVTAKLTSVDFLTPYRAAHHG